MAEAVVSYVTDKIASLAHTEMLNLGGIKKDILELEENLRRIQSSLKDADEEEERSERTRVWVKQVQELCYDIEDVLDEFAVQQHQYSSHGCFGKISSLLRIVKSRHQLASSIRDIRSRMVVVSEAYERYGVYVDLREEDMRSGAGKTEWYDRRTDSVLLEENEVVGIEKPKNLLMHWLMDGEKPHELAVVSVVGMGGLGKTTLAKMVYEDVQIKMHFEVCAWITVSYSYRTEEILKNLIRQILVGTKTALLPEIEYMSILQLCSVIRSVLESRRFIVVLDDVWQEDLWDALGPALPRLGMGSRVLVTTRIRGVARVFSTENESMVYEMLPLSLEQSWVLFCRKTFRDGTCPPELRDVSERILIKCGGLPLAIVAISGLLATKSRRGLEAWEIVHRRLGTELESNVFLAGAAKILLLSYNDLPYYLKSCLMYLSLFPENCMIGHNRLIRLWIAEGFVKEKQGLTLEEVGEEYLVELVNRSLIQVVEKRTDGSIKTWHIHDLLRDIILRKSSEQNFATIVGGRNIAMLEKVHRLSVDNSLPSVERIRVLSRLRTLLMFWGLDSSMEFALPSGGLKLLRVLDLSDAPLNKFPIELGNMVHLRYLSFRNTKLDCIPRFIGKLQQLETLDLSNSFVTTLPVEIQKLQKLRHLLVHFLRKRGFVCPAILEGFQSLQTLCFIDLDRDGELIIKMLGKLGQLRRLGIINLRVEEGMLMCSSIEKLNNLRSLSVTSIQEDEIIRMEHVSLPPRFLERVYLAGRLEKLPEWLLSLNNLVKLRLKWSRLRDDPIKFLQHLPNLKHLELFQVYEGEDMCFGSGGFAKLKYLSLDQLNRLQSVEVEEGALPSLEKLILRRCKLLKNLPYGIEHLFKLEVLQILDMPEEFTRALHPDGEDRWRIRHVSSVDFSSSM